jgi:hypothetical protein
MAMRFSVGRKIGLNSKYSMDKWELTLRSRVEDLDGKLQRRNIRGSEILTKPI